MLAKTDFYPYFCTVMTKNWLLWLYLTTVSGTLMAQQRTVVVADRNTHEPIAQASLYTKQDGQFHSCITNDNGVADIRFDFTKLTVSHLNYEKRQLTLLHDTIFLTPRFQQTAEVVVRNIEPRWIREKLRKVVKKKQQNYFSRPRMLSYDYRTQSIGNNSYYHYQSLGMIRMKSEAHDGYAISQTEGAIISADSTQLTDVANLRRMLYEDFVAELDAEFIRSHRFNENGDFKSDNRNEVELVFRTKDRAADDRGRIVIDTARCIIRSAYRITGTKTNLSERMPFFLRSFARLMSGYRVDRWNRTYRVSYHEEPDGTLFPEEVSYKFYMETYDNEQDEQENEFDEQTGGGFPNMESTLRLQPATTLSDSIEWMSLPGSWYLRLSSENERQQEVRLAHLPARFELFKEDVDSCHVVDR